MQGILIKSRPRPTRKRDLREFCIAAVDAAALTG